MSEGDIQSLVQYRMEQAEEALEAARLLLKANLCRQAAGRAYYAMFYAVTALLALRRLGTSKHSGALALFDKEFVKKGIFGQDHSRSLHELFDLRQRADYRDMFEVSHARAEMAIDSAAAFLNDVRKYLASGQ
jgi:uncharacterized protein (UPF0332 family)